MMDGRKTPAGFPGGPVGKILVTGGGSGIGKAVAEALAARGSEVVVVGRRVERLAAVASAHPGRIQALPCDLEDPGEREGLLLEAREMLGGLDGVVYSAGNVSHQLPGHIQEVSLRSQMELNLVAPFRIGEQALETLSPGGGVVFLSSTLATRPIATSAIYSAAKAGLLAAMKSLALAGAEKGIRFNAVLPGLVDTDMVREPRLAPGESVSDDGEEAERRLVAQLEGFHGLHPLGRMGQPEEVARAVIHLLDAKWATGSEWVLDGGLLLR